MFSVFPNPSNGKFNLKANTQGEYFIRIYNLDGNLVMSRTLGNSNEIIDLNGQSGGVYLLEVVADNKRYLRKLVKN
jgi:hypothetical protein